SKNVNVIAFCSHNFTPDVTVDLREGSSPNPDGTVISVGIDWAYHTMGYRFPESYDSWYWTIDISDPSNEYGVLDIGYLVIGQLTEFNFGFRYGWNFVDMFHNLRSHSEFATPNVAYLNDNRSIALNFEPLNISETATLVS